MKTPGFGFSTALTQYSSEVMQKNRSDDNVVSVSLSFLLFFLKKNGNTASQLNNIKYVSMCFKMTTSFWLKTILNECFLFSYFFDVFKNSKIEHYVSMNCLYSQD